MDSEIAKAYGNKVRIRICGLCWQGETLLMVRHKFEKNYFWAPPGGGLEFGESIEFGLKREFLEETGLIIQPQRFAFGCEFIKGGLHAVELFFNVVLVSGELIVGRDPELQLIDKVQFLTPTEIGNLPDEALHGIFRKCKDANDLRSLNGFYTI
jgi:8-oxo-dGTP diphosphatase